MVWSLVLVPVLALAVSSSEDDPRDALAVVDARGAVLVSLDGGEAWTAVHHCPLAGDDDEPGCGEPPAAMAWHGGALYLACSGSALWRWQPGQAAAGPVELPGAPGAPGTPVALAAGPARALWIIDDEDRLWSWQPGQAARVQADVPERARAMAARDHTVAIASASGIWELAPDRSVTLTAPLHACALAARGDTLWIGGPDGLFSLRRGVVSSHSVTPVTGVGVAGDDVLVVRDTTLERLPASGPPAPLQTAVPVSGLSLTARPALAGAYRSAYRRAEIAPWIPRLTLAITAQRAPGARRAALWLWLEWPLL